MARSQAQSTSQSSVLMIWHRPFRTGTPSGPGLPAGVGVPSPWLGNQASQTAWPDKSTQESPLGPVEHDSCYIEKQIQVIWGLKMRFWAKLSLAAALALPSC